MERFLQKIYQKKQIIFRSFLIVVFSASVLYFFPRGVTFRYDFQKGKPWLHESLYAPFDFPIYKTQEELDKEAADLTNEVIPFYEYNEQAILHTKEEYEAQFDNFFKNRKLYPEGIRFIDSIYENGVVVSKRNIPQKEINLLLAGNRIKKIALSDVNSLENLQSTIADFFTDEKDNLYKLFFEIISPNLEEKKSLTQKAINEELDGIALTRGNVDKGAPIIMKGEIVEGDKYRMLESLKKELSSQTWNEEGQKWLPLGYSLLIFLSSVFLMLYIRRHHPAIYDDENKLIFVYFNILLMIILTHFVIEYKSEYIYTVPIAIVSLTLSAFFGNSFAFINQLVMIFLISFIVPNSFEFLFIQFTIALVIALTKLELYKRANLFLIIGQITFTYLVFFVIFNIIQEGSNFLTKLRWENLSLFAINGLLTLFVQPLIYIYEKTFSLTSDISLLELSDVNTKLLRELAEKAPGTFQHSLQVANLAESAATRIGVSRLMVRVGALYHDIGKMEQPSFFTENQTSVVSPHDDLSPKESSKIIVNHVIKGIEIAKKNKLPDHIIDFIRTHHGTSVTRYFYLKEKENNPDEVSLQDFQYPGPIPFSKETAIVMMADAIEASSKSLKSPTKTSLENFVEKIVSIQVGEGQFMNSNITFKEIEQIKKVFKKKLSSIYNFRIEYPE